MRDLADMNLVIKNKKGRITCIVTKDAKGRTKAITTSRNLHRVRDTVKTHWSGMIVFYIAKDDREMYGEACKMKLPYPDTMSEIRFLDKDQFTIVDPVGEEEDE